jgi:hypothetical protein
MEIQRRDSRKVLFLKRINILGKKEATRSKTAMPAITK